LRITVPMKMASFWILLLVTVSLLGWLSMRHFERMLTKRFYVGEATIRMLPSAPDYLSDALVRKYVEFALASNSLDPTRWRFLPTVQDTNAVISRHPLRSNDATVQLVHMDSNTSPHKMSNRLIVSLNLTNSKVHVYIRRPK
jgi:hypothetical protein